MSTTVTLDPICAEAVDLARAEAEAEAGAPLVGEHRGAEPEGERMVVHYFDCLDRAYRGWRWAVTVSRAARANRATVCDVSLLPGPQAVLAPSWVPWQQRVRPGDVGVGDVLPTPADDPRLVPGYAQVSDDEVAEVAAQLGLGRTRVLSLEGRDLAGGRWHGGTAGPGAPIAKAVGVDCGTCGFYVPLSGGLRRAFGVCANEYAPDDGRVVSADHGCGAHSEIVDPVAQWSAPSAPDEIVIVDRDVELPPGSVTDSDSGEPLGHS